MTEEVKSKPQGTVVRPLPDEYYFETEENEWGVFFFRPNGFLNNWTYCDFTLDGYQYCCAEQAIMHQKALLFKDPIAASKIMKTKNSKTQKALGRAVKGFVQTTWDESVASLAYRILYAKFSQNPKFAEALRATGNKHLFETNPYDKVWAVGKSIADAMKETDVEKAKQWQGNLLGKTLMQVRAQLAQHCTQ